MKVLLLFAVIATIAHAMPKLNSVFKLPSDKNRIIGGGDAPERELTLILWCCQLKGYQLITVRNSEITLGLSCPFKFT